MTLSAETPERLQELHNSVNIFKQAYDKDWAEYKEITQSIADPTVRDTISKIDKEGNDFANNMLKVVELAQAGKRSEALTPFITRSARAVLPPCATTSANCRNMELRTPLT